MAITYIKRIDGATNSLVQLDTSDTTAVALAPGYLTAQAANIIAVNGGGWTWEPNDLVIVSASDGVSLAFINSAFTRLIPLSANASGYYQTTVTLAQFLANYGTPVLVVPAPGANLMTILTGMQIIQTYGSAALAGGGAVTPQYGNTIHGGGIAAGTSVAAADFEQTASTVYPIIGVSGSGKFLPESSCGNAGIYLSNPTAVFTAGTGSTFVVKSHFYVIDLV